MSSIQLYLVFCVGLLAILALVHCNSDTDEMRIDEVSKLCSSIELQSAGNDPLAAYLCRRFLAKRTFNFQRSKASGENTIPPPPGFIGSRGKKSAYWTKLPMDELTAY